MEGQELLQSDDFDFELREPGQRDRHFVIDVAQDGKTQRYNVRLDGSAAATANGRTLSDALHELANVLEGWRAYGTDVFDPERISRERLRMCDRCTAPIFFALTPKGKWMPLDGEPHLVTSKERKLPAYERPRTFLVVDSGGQPKVQSLSNPQGYVWLAHPDICGVNTEAPTIPSLLVRWEDNRKKALDRQNSVADGLRDVIRVLEGDISDGN